MQDKTIDIAVNDVCTEVYLMTANAAQQRGDINNVATADNVRVISQFIESGKLLLEKSLGRYSTGVINGTIGYSMPDNWPDRSEEVDGYAKVFLANYAIARWYELNGTGDRFEAMANEALGNIVLILSKRKKY